MPRVISDGARTVVRGSEGLGPLFLAAAGATTFASVLTNPILVGGTGEYGLNGTWLGRQSTLFNRYRFLSLRLRFVPFVSTSTAGRVTIGWNGDYNDTQPSTVNQVSQYQNSVESPIWREIGCNMLAPSIREFAVSSTPANGMPIQAGVFEVVTDQGTAGANVGSLYIDYVVEFWNRAAFAVNT